MKLCNEINICVNCGRLEDDVLRCIQHHNFYVYTNKNGLLDKINMLESHLIQIIGDFREPQSIHVAREALRKLKEMKELDSNKQDKESK